MPSLRSEHYQRRQAEVGGWRVGIVSYRLGSRFICEVDNLDPGARLAGADGDRREDAEQQALATARRRLARTRVHVVDLGWNSMIKPQITSFFHKQSNTIAHLVRAPDGRHCAVIDAALDFDQAAGRTDTDLADRIVAHVREHGLTVDWILETHAHADHLSAAPYLKQQLGGKIGIGEHITDVQKLFKTLFNVEKTFNTDGSQFDQLFKEGDRFRIGGLEAYVLHTPGHTPACVTYVIGDAAFVGDTLFMPDGGTARADFPGGDAATLYRSIEKILALPPETRLFVCHDYGPGGRPIAWETTVAEERAKNVHVREGVSEPEFVKMRSERDKQLAVPTLLMPSIQVNMRAGELPPPEDNGVSYIKIPINKL